MSPERISGKLENDFESLKKADVWSIGVLLYILIAGHPPFDGKTNDEIHAKICSVDFMFPGREWDLFPEAKNLIYHLLQLDPAERFDAHEAVNHPFFNLAA